MGTLALQNFSRNIWATNPSWLRYDPLVISSQDPEPGSAPDCAAWAVELLPRLRKLAAAKYGVPLQDCEDVVQSAIVDFLLQSRKYETTDPGLLVVITRRRCIDFWRSRQLQERKTVSIELIPDNDPRLVQGDEYVKGLLDGIALALAWVKITPRCQKLLAQRFFRHRRAEDIAIALGDTLESVKRYMSRCLARLRSVMVGRV